MDKGARIRVVKGRKHKGATGTVFWTGPDRFKEGRTRLGVHADDGETIWIPADYAELLTPGDDGFEPPPPPTPPDKGERVRFEHDGATLIGTVFWIGEGRDGGYRVGVRPEGSDGEDDAVWLDARQVTRLADEDAALEGDQDIPF